MVSRSVVVNVSRNGSYYCEGDDEAVALLARAVAQLAGPQAVRARGLIPVTAEIKIEADLRDGRS